MSGKRDRASELRAIADGRLMLRVRNGVTVARSMLARIADEFEAMSTALAAKDAELAEVWQQYVDANEARIDAEAQLAEARKALDALGAFAFWFQKYPEFKPNPDMQAEMLADLDRARPFIPAPQNRRLRGDDPTISPRMCGVGRKT